jgi:hypothetical protein
MGAPSAIIWRENNFFKEGRYIETYLEKISWIHHRYRLPGAAGIFCYSKWLLVIVMPADLCYCWCSTMCILFLLKSDLFQAVILLEGCTSFSPVSSLMIHIFQDSHQNQGEDDSQLFLVFVMMLVSLSIDSKPGPHEHWASSNWQEWPLISVWLAN